MAQSFIDALAGDFNPEEYTDSYREALETLVQSKADGIPLAEEPEAPKEAEGRPRCRLARLGGGGEEAPRAGGAGQGDRLSRYVDGITNVPLPRTSRCEPTRLDQRSESASKRP